MTLLGGTLVCLQRMSRNQVSEECFRFGESESTLSFGGLHYELLYRNILSMHGDLP